MARRAWLLYLCLGAAALATYRFVPGGRQGWVFNLLAVSSPIAIVIGVRLWKPKSRASWYLFALGQILFVAGDVITYNYDTFFGVELPYPSVGDVLYVAVYPCLIAGLLVLTRRRSPGRDRDSVIDAFVVAIGIGTLQWIFLMSPVAHDSASSDLQKLVGMSYPLMDLFLFTAVVRLALGAGKRAPAMYLMAGAALALFVTDSAYTYIVVQGVVYNQHGILEAGWALFYFLWGAAALHPSMRTIEDRAPELPPRPSKARLLLLGGASLIAPTVMVLQQWQGLSVDLPVVVGAAVVLFILVVVRMAGLVHRQEQSTLREMALRTAGSALVTATNRDGIYAAALEATRSLVGEDASIRVLIAGDGEEAREFTLVAAAGGREEIVGDRINLSVLPPWKRQVLLSHGSYQVPVRESELAAPLGFPSEAAFVLNCPFFVKEALGGMVVAATPTQAPEAIRHSMETLSTQIALALDSAHATEQLLTSKSEARFASLVQNATDVIMVVDADSTIRYLSPSVERMLGYAPSLLEGTRLTGLIQREERANVLQFLTSAERGADDHPALTEFRMRHKLDFWVNVEALRTNLLHDENVRGIVLNTRDVSERKAFEEQLAHQAFHDSVTGLANRSLFKDRVQHAIERQGRDGDPVTILFMDLDDFKTINDSLGHAEGDRLLAEVGERVKGSLRAGDTAARLGGDEFAVLLEDGGDGVDAAEVASRILGRLEAPFHLEGNDVFVRASIGIASADQAEVTRPEGSEELLRNADVAMYMAKEAGKGRYQVFEPAMHDTALRRLELKADLQRAVDNGEFILHFQPVIDLTTGQIEGVEALIRWMHPRRGMVPPLDFIPLAEETGLIVPIGKWVLREAALRAKELQGRFPMVPPLQMSVNLSARELQRPEMVDDVAATLMETGLDPSSLVLEITESVMMQDMELSIQRLTELKELGVKLAVDDFGTGYSSLNYIRRFPVDILKIDKSFVDGVNDGGEESALMAAIIDLAGILKLRPVAEGIERADQLERLLAMKCDLGQGFYFAEALPLEGIEDLLTARKALATRETELSS
jgi:diguanylate cyclase (GGDEF)-like protein/PAS domain S-box-containing protein